jgi:energy-coupling factor transporter ATP-binding protein EcfA2
VPFEIPTIERFDRKEFISERFDYKPGEHVTIIGPTGSGKTTLGYQLLQEVTSPELQGIVFVMKPRDETATKWNKTLDYRRVATWPPPMSPWRPKKPSGYTLWPRTAYDPEIDDDTQYVEFRKAILDSYKKGSRILFCDETASLTAELGLERELKMVWSKGRSMKCGTWSATQRPTHIPLLAYSSAHHLFLHNDPDERNRKRFDEIGGVDPKLVQSVVGRLPKHEWLYIRRDGPVMAIVSK